MGQERGEIMIYVQLRHFCGPVAWEVNKMNDLNFKKNSKEFKRIQKDCKRSKERGGIMTFVQLRGFHGFRRSNGIEKAKKGSRR